MHDFSQSQLKQLAGNRAVANTPQLQLLLKDTDELLRQNRPNVKKLLIVKMGPTKRGLSS
ncbi:MAG: hypothetical protein Tsb009_24260 [Planctomycetaceae bacterium]